MAQYCSFKHKAVCVNGKDINLYEGFYNKPNL